RSDASAGDGTRGSAQNVSSDESILGADVPAGPASSDLRASSADATGDDGSGRANSPEQSIAPISQPR
ncbi:MAG: hypothetical protein L0H36_03450, partial [bacterium]|nr:hypothetical protein [bacterium]